MTSHYCPNCSARSATSWRPTASPLPWNARCRCRNWQIRGIGCWIARTVYVLAQHFYSDEVQGARARRPSDAAEAEISVVAGKAASLKLGVMTYLTKVAEALQKLALPLN